jgi:alpha-amylase
METAYADLPSGTYIVNPQQPTISCRLSAITAANGAQLVYTTDGSQPTAASTVVAHASTVSLPVGTTTLKVGLLKGGQVSGIVTREYVVKEGQSTNPAEVEIPAFCIVGQGETCAFFEAPASWGNIKCWRWDKQYNYTGNQWPGVDCTFIGTAANGLKVWKWSWDGNKKSQTSPNEGIIFNDGARQTADLPFENGGYYTESGLAGNVILGIDESEALRVKSEKFANAPIYNLQGRLIENRNSDGAAQIENRKSVNRKIPKGVYIQNGRKLVVR